MAATLAGGLLANDVQARGGGAAVDMAGATVEDLAEAISAGLAEATLAGSAEVTLAGSAALAWRTASMESTWAAVSDMNSAITIVMPGTRIVTVPRAGIAGRTIGDTRGNGRTSATDVSILVAAQAAAISRW
jgi:hypothetical protein